MTLKNKTHDDMIRWIYNRKYQSVWTCCLGPNQSGKTDFNLFQMERIHALGLGDGFGSNIPNLDTSKLDTPFDIDFIEDFETLKKTCQMLNPDPEKHGIKRYFFLADEMGDWAPKDMSWLNVKFIKELQQVRKYGLNFLGCAISRVDERILNEKHFHGYFMKLSKSDPTRAAYVDWFRGGKTAQIYNIPRTNINFNTWYSASFYMEPPIRTESMIPLNQEHKMILEYLEKGCSWDKTEYNRTQGKRAMDKIARFHMSHCLKSLPEESTNEDVSEPSE
jgi:hypothetical protein